MREFKPSDLDSILESKRMPMRSRSIRASRQIKEKEEVKPIISSTVLQRWSDDIKKQADKNNVTADNVAQFVEKYLEIRKEKMPDLDQEQLNAMDQAAEEFKKSFSVTESTNCESKGCEECGIFENEQAATTFKDFVTKMESNKSLLSSDSADDESLSDEDKAYVKARTDFEIMKKYTKDMKDTKLKEMLMKEAYKQLPIDEKKKKTYLLTGLSFVGLSLITSAGSWYEVIKILYKLIKYSSVDLSAGGLAILFWILAKWFASVSKVAMDRMDDPEYTARQDIPTNEDYGTNDLF